MIHEPVIEVIKEKYNEIFSAEKKVADYILENPKRAINKTVTQLAKSSGVSDATVVRMCHHLGYKGYYQFRLMLARDVGREGTENVGLNVVSRIFQGYANEISCMGENIEHDLMRHCVDLIRKCRQVHIIAVGNTMPLALYMGFRFGRIGISSSYGVSPEYFMNCINLGNNYDVVLAISQSGSSKQVIQGIELAKEKSMKVISITGDTESLTAKMSDYVLATKEAKESSTFDKGYAHLKETAMIDALLDMVMNWDKIRETDADKPEVFLSEYKY